MANLFLTGSGVPTNAVGEVTDYYRDTATNLIYYRAALGWEVVPSLVPTPDGVGTNWLFGTGAPDNGIGGVNDYYRDDVSGSVYRKHSANGWEAKGSLDFIGVYGVQWGEGTGAPANIESLNNLPAGSFYLDVATSDIYYKDNTLTWSLKGQLGGSGAGGGVTYIARDTFANIINNYPAANFSGMQAFATNMGLRGCPVYSNGTGWRRLFSVADYAGVQKVLFIGGSGATYSQTGTTVTVTWTAHGFSAYEFNSAWAYLVQSTGDLLTGWFTDFTYVDANTFTVISTVSQSTSGNLGTNTAETDLPIGYTFPSTAGFFEINDLLSFSGLIRNKNSGNTKTMKLYIGANSVSTSVQTTSSNWVNVGSPNLMKISATQLIIIGGIQITPANTTVKATLQLANSADWACCIFNRASIAPSS